MQCPPSASSRAMASRYSAAAAQSPKNSSWSGRGAPNENAPPDQGAAPSPGRVARENGSSASNPRAAVHAVCASAAVRAKIETQSSVRQAGTTPRVLSSPRVGFSPTMSLNAAGTRPDPAVSVPSEKLTRSAATATADPELEPPDMYFGLNTLEQAPWGERVPTRPVANW